MNKTISCIIIITVLTLGMVQAVEWTRFNNRQQPLVTNKLLMTQKNLELKSFYENKPYYSNACGRITITNIVSKNSCLVKGFKYCETTQKNVKDYKNCTNQFRNRCNQLSEDYSLKAVSMPKEQKTITIDIPCTTKSKFESRRIQTYSFKKQPRKNYGAWIKIWRKY